MACLDHYCLSCGAVFFSNGADSCTECGSEEFTTNFDEYETEENPGEEVALLEAMR